LAIMMTSEVAGQTGQGYDAMLAEVGPALRSAQGLLLHASHPTEDGWRVVGIWETREDATRFYATTIAPNLPKGIRPKLSVALLHDVLQP
jgi:hypothetical protein